MSITNEYFRYCKTEHPSDKERLRAWMLMRREITLRENEERMRQDARDRAYQKLDYWTRLAMTYEHEFGVTEKA